MIAHDAGIGRPWASFPTGTPGTELGKGLTSAEMNPSIRPSPLFTAVMSGGTRVTGSRTSSLPRRFRFHGPHLAVPARWSLLVFAVALVGMVIIYHQLWADPSHRVLGSRNHGNDPMQMMWFLRWVPWSIAHGQSPFDSTAIFYPHGFALTWNTFVPTLSIVAAPITFTMGATYSFAVLITLGPALTALTGFWWLRRHTERAGPAAVGGLMIAFSPFVAGHLLGHLNLVFLPLVPIIVMLLEDLLWRFPRKRSRTVVYLAVAVAAQAGISEEVLIILGLTVLATAVAAAAVMPRATASAVRNAIGPVLAAAAIFVLLAAPMLVSQLFTGRHVLLQSQRFQAVAQDYVYSSTRQIWQTANGHRSFLGGAEDGVYLGWALLIALAVGVVLTWHRDRLVRIAAIAGLILVALTFGNSGLPHVWLPWRLVSAVADLRSVLPARLALGTSLVIAWLVSRWIDQLWLAARRREPAGYIRHRTARASAIGALALVLIPLLTWTPRALGTSALPAPVPFFGSAVEHRMLTAGSAVLILPMPWSGDARAMYYQQLDNFRFKQIDGYALLPHGQSNADADILRQLGTVPVDRHGRIVPRPSLAQGRSALGHLHPSAIIVLLNAPNAPRLIELAGNLTARPPDLRAEGVAIWVLSPANGSSQPDPYAVSKRNERRLATS